MTHLLNGIRAISEEAAYELESIRFTNDSDIRTLNRQDLLELLPGKHNLRVRKEIDEFICSLPPQPKAQRKSPSETVNEDKYATNSGSTSHFRGFFYLPRFFSNQQRQDSATDIQPKPYNLPKLQLASVLYEMVVSGITLDKHLDIIEKVNGPVPGHQVNLQLKETTDKNSQVLIVFCPVVSRAGTDVNAALQAIHSDKPIIIVAMHHLHTPACYPVPTGPNVELGVNIFFHETKGLLECKQNEDAITEMKTKLLEFNMKISCTNAPSGMR